MVAIYDTVNAYEPKTQPDFYAQLAAETGASSIVDLGCGTGLITCELARRGHRMIGVEPSAAMLEIARRRPVADRVTWIRGGYERLGTPDADLAIMSGHVAQFFVDDESWQAVLAALHAALRAGGRLAFESRNPRARAWEQWTNAARVSVDDPAAGRIDTWAEVDDVANGVVSYANHYLFAARDEELVSPLRLRFRTLEELTCTLAEAGFAIEAVYGDWDRRPAAPATRELIVVATRA